jgi:hypothetical protein
MSFLTDIFCFFPVEYVVALTHVSIKDFFIVKSFHNVNRALNVFFSFLTNIPVQREAWQSLISILESKAEVSSFCLELSKKLDMRYKSLPLPVDLALVQRNHIGTTPSTDGNNNNNPAGLAAADTNSELGAKIAAAMASNANSNDEASALNYKEVAAMFNV